MTAELDASLGRAGSAATPPEGNRRRRLAKVLALGLIAAALAVVSFAVRDALAVASEVRAGRLGFAALVNEGLSGQSNLTAAARTGARRFEAARSRANGSLWLGAWARVPVLGRPANWLRAATGATAMLSRTAAGSVARIEPRLDAAGSDPSARLELLTALETEFGRLGVATRRVKLPGTGWFLPPVNSAARALNGDLARLRGALEDGVVVARGLRSFLAGPSRFIMLAANNAEMRAGGMVLQAGLLQTGGGRVVPGIFRPTADLLLPTPVAVPPEIQALYGFLEPGREWRNVGSSPNFPAVGPIYAALAERKAGGRVDGALQIDVIGVKALLGVLGPVEAEGRRYEASTVARLVLHDVYAEYDLKPSALRQHEFSALASATLRALNERHWKFGDLVGALKEAVNGRHLLVWSRDTAQQAAWQRVGIDGSLDRDGLLVTVQNHSGNKLDWFVTPSVSLSAKPGPGGSRNVTMLIRIPNPTPATESVAVAGDGAFMPPGDYRALVALYLPGWASNIHVLGYPVIVAGTDGPMRVIGTRFDVPRGTSTTITVTFTVPPGKGEFLLLPSGRARPVRYLVGDRVVNDAVVRRIAL